MAERGQGARRLLLAIDGVVLVDKPTGLTSNAVLQRVRRAYQAEKGGHTGTLDPLASGLLPICLGEATKFSVGLLDADKRYRAVIELGVVTETGDREGAVLATRPPPSAFAQIEQALPAFRGEIQQRPHRYSAIKRDGRALYTYARAGVDVEIDARTVHIRVLEVEQWEPPYLTVDVLCSKGTYIRSLAEDIGDRIGCGGHVRELRRTMVGHLAIADSTSLEALESSQHVGRDRALHPVSLMVERLPRIELDVVDCRRFLHGQRIVIDRPPCADEPMFSVRLEGTSGDEGFVGIATLTFDDASTVLLPARVVSANRARLPSGH